MQNTGLCVITWSISILMILRRAVLHFITIIEPPIPIFVKSSNMPIMCTARDERDILSCNQADGIRIRTAITMYLFHSINDNIEKYMKS